MNVPTPAGRTARGFTLMELIIALLISGVLVSVISMAFYRSTSEAMLLRDVTDSR